MSRIIRVRSSLMRHLHPENWDGGKCALNSVREKHGRPPWRGDAAPMRARHGEQRGLVRSYRVSGLVQQHGRADWPRAAGRLPWPFLGYKDTGDIATLVTITDFTRW